MRSLPFITSLIAALFVGGGQTLRLIDVIVPAYKLRGETALLECQFEFNDSKLRPPEEHRYLAGISAMALDDADVSHEQRNEAESLYSVKWYKDNEEFYRFVPKANPPQHSYRVDGITVDHNLSDSRKVILRGIKLKSTGMYRCEVSAEAPSFASVMGEGRMEVVYLPKEGPHINGEEKQYQVGDRLSLNCTSGKSHPASLLHWYINDEPVNDPSLLVQYQHIVHVHGLVTTILGLELPVDGRHFEQGTMRVKCVASVSPIIWQGGRESIVQRRPAQLMNNREAMLLVRSLANGNQVTIGLITSMLIVLRILQDTSFV